MTDAIVAAVKSFLDYAPDTGVFRWRSSRTGKAKAGSIAGTKHPDGYITIGLNGKLYLAHRLAWAWAHGRFPEKHIDHINGDPSDNRLSNLRQASASENAQSLAKYKNNSSGWTGVYRRGERFRASIRCGRKLKWLGTFSTPDEAREAYLAAKRDLHYFQPIPRPNHEDGTKMERKRQ